MTKLREPLTIEDALTRTLGNLTPVRASEACGRTTSYLLEASDPAKSQQLTVADMLKLDVEHLQLDGTAPIFAAVGRMLEVARAEIYVDAAAIGNALLAVLKEDGEAHVALYRASQPGASDHDLIEAMREGGESSDAHVNAVAAVRRALDHRREERAARPP